VARSRTTGEQRDDAVLGHSFRARIARRHRRSGYPVHNRLTEEFLQSYAIATHQQGTVGVERFGERRSCKLLSAVSIFTQRIE
jgi:hypothetical protein